MISLTDKYEGITIVTNTKALRHAIHCLHCEADFEYHLDYASVAESLAKTGKYEDMDILIVLDVNRKWQRSVRLPNQD